MLGNYIRDKSKYIKREGLKKRFLAPSNPVEPTEKQFKLSFFLYKKQFLMSAEN